MLTYQLKYRLPKDETDNTMHLVQSNPKANLISPLITNPLLRFSDLDTLQKRMNMTCKPTVTTGKWYRVEYVCFFSLIHRSVHCYSNKDHSNVFTEAFTPTPSAAVEKDSGVETVKPTVQSKAVSSSKKSVILLSIVVLLSVAAVVGVVLSNKRDENEHAFVNNRITAPLVESQYGTFDFSVCLEVMCLLQKTCVVCCVQGLCFMKPPARDFHNAVRNDAFIAHLVKGTCICRDCHCTVHVLRFSSVLWLIDVGLFLPNGIKGQSENTRAESFFLLGEANDTCAYEIMASFFLYC